MSIDRVRSETEPMVTSPYRAVVQESRYEREPGYAERYRDRRFQTGSGSHTDRRERRAIATLLQQVPDLAKQPQRQLAPRPWLDVPCGAGRLTDELPGPVVQVDRDANMVAAAGEQWPRACASVHALPFADDSFDGVLCMRLLQHIATPVERIRILGELARVTSGPIVLSFFDSCSLQHLRRRLRPLFGKRRSGRYAVSRSNFRRELAEAQLRILAMHSLSRFVGEQTLVLCMRKSS
jgi:ubiquinone/menaquinone biosynthesis C-methylase UbiE